MLNVTEVYLSSAEKLISKVKRKEVNFTRK